MSCLRYDKSVFICVNEIELDGIPSTARAMDRYDVGHIVVTLEDTSSGCID